MKKIIPYSFLLLTFISCSDNEQKLEEITFYNLRTELTRQAADNHERGLGIVKTIERGGKQEQKIFQKPDWLSELRPFMDCDLNKPAYATAYHKDSVQQNDTLLIIYTAVEKKLAVRELKLQMLKGKLVGMSADVARSNSYFSLHEQLSYIPGVSYSIIGKQHTVLAGENKYSITSQFAFIK